MRLGWMALAFFVGGLGSVATSCGAVAFTCASDDECQSGAAAGVCQDNGHCSFPDEGCPSGQRFGDAAPPGVANACVDLGGTDGSTTVDEGSTTVGDASTTVSVDEGSTGPGESTDSAEESGPVDGCGKLLVDEFDDAALDPMWSAAFDIGGEVLVEGGRLWLTIPPSMNGSWASVYTELDAVAGGWTRIRIDDVDESKANVGLALNNGACELQVLVNGQSVNVFSWDVAMQAGLVLASEDLPGLPISLQLVVHDDGSVSFEHSQDEVTWTSIADGTFEACGSFTGPLSSVIFLNGDIPQGASQGYQRFEACLP